MRLIILIFAAVMFVASPVLGQDKEPRDSDDKKEEKREKPGAKLDKIKDKLSKKSTHDDDDDDDNDSDGFLDIEFVLDLWGEVNLNYYYTPYPYYNGGLLKRDSTHFRELHFESALSAFSGGSNINAFNFYSKLKFFTLFGVEFQYSDFTENDLLSNADMQMYRLKGIVNLISSSNFILELKFGGWNIADVGSGSLFGFQADIAPAYPIMLIARADFSQINGHNVSDYAVTLGYVYKNIEFFGGYRAFDLAGETMNGPTGGAVIRF